MYKSMFHTYAKLHVKLYFCVCHIFWYQMGRQKMLNNMVASVSQNLFVLHVFVSAILIHSQ